MDAGDIFVYVMTAIYFGLIAFLALTSRRRHSEAVKQETPGVSVQESEVNKPRKAA